MTAASAEITSYESNARYHDKQNYPQWAELMPYIRALAKPSPAQPNGDPRINFNQHPKLVLDDLYELAKAVSANDPNFKKPAAGASGSPAKSYTQEELDAKVAEASKKASDDEALRLKNEAKGGSVTGMSKGASKGKPGEVDKEALWNMPLSDLGNAVKKATERLRD
jgi:hypothetical protein